MTGPDPYMPRKQIASALPSSPIWVQRAYICHQTNCIGCYPAGLAKTIASKLRVCPYACRTPLKGRNLAIPEHRVPLGKILIEKSPVNDVNVVCMFAQYSYGKVGSSSYYAKDETYTGREAAFAKCLRKMDKRIPRDAVVAFPKFIGCGMGGGSWTRYKPMIEKFAINRNVLLVDFTG